MYINKIVEFMFIDYTRSHTEELEFKVLYAFLAEADPETLANENIALCVNYCQKELHLDMPGFLDLSL